MIEQRDTMQVKQMADHSGSTQARGRLTRRVFLASAAVTGAAGAAVGPASGAAGPQPARAGAVAWNFEGRPGSGYRGAPLLVRAPIVVLLHGMAGLDHAAQELCRGLSVRGVYAIAPKIFDPGAAGELHHIDDRELGRSLEDAAAFARGEGADPVGCIYLSLGACGTRFIKSADSRFSRILLHFDPRLAGAGDREHAKDRLVKWLGNSPTPGGLELGRS